jgi:hypothetical protein
MREGYLQRRYAELSGLGDERARGRAFEELLRDLFELSAHHARLNPRTSQPRQTDLYVETTQGAFLVEAKWQKRRQGSPDIDGLRVRLEDLPGRVAGLFFSVSGFNGHAISRVEQRRQREVLLFDGSEIEQLCRSPERLYWFIQEKRRTLARDGNMAFLSDGFDPINLPTPEPRRWPEPESKLVGLDGKPLAWVAGMGEFGSAAFTRHLPDIDWRTSPGAGVNFDLRISLESRSDLPKLFEAIHQTLGLTSRGCWTIVQSSTTWFGTGASNLVASLGRWDERYRAFPRRRFHNAEEATYVDETQEGYYTLCVYVQATERGHIRSTDLSVQLPGVPLDTQRLRSLAEKFGAGDTLYFRPLGEKSVFYAYGTPLGGPPEDVIKVKPVARAVDEEGDEQWVTGVVVRNPWFRKRPPPATEDDDPALDRQRDVMMALSRFELLPCYMGQHHEPDDIVDYYYIRFVEASWTSDVMMIRAVVDWNEITTSASPRI